VLAELKHLKNYLGLFLETFSQKISKFTYKKLENLIAIAAVLRDGGLNNFFTCDDEALYKFYNANLRYDSEVKHWLANFKSLPDISKFADKIEYEIDNWGENYRSSKILLNVIKRINKCAAKPVKEKDEPEWIKRAYEIEEARSRILANTDLSDNFLTLGGGINDRKREEFLKPLYNLHKLCAQVFMDYNADAFNSVCCGAAGGQLRPLISGLLSAASAFNRSCEHFMKVVKADKSDAQHDAGCQYARNISVIVPIVQNINKRRGLFQNSPRRLFYNCRTAAPWRRIRRFVFFTIKSVL